MHATAALTRPLLWVIVILLRKAIARHLQQMRDSLPAQIGRGG
jgi:hypothetical protein